MSWPNGEIRKIKITLERPIYGGNSLVVIFAIDGSQSDEFHDMLFEYFEFIEKNDGMILHVEETVDAETNARCELSIAIAGLNQHAFAQELHAKAQTHNFTRAI